MEDLREVGKKALDSINNLGASDIGDLVLGIGEIIEELRDTPEDKRKLKLDHLKGLFREFAHGEEYELRDEVLEPQVPQDDGMVMRGSVVPPLSGMVSGMLPKSAYPNLNAIYPPQQPISPIVYSYKTSSSSQGSFDDDADYDDEEEEEEEIKLFVPAWWKVQPSSQTNLDDFTEPLDN